MKVSVIIPAYNEEKHIENTIRSVLKQSHKNTEIIVVDNNSKDNTVNIIKKFPEVIFLEEKKQGVQFARECGRKKVTGDIVANLDADCLPDPDWIKRAVKYFENPVVVAVSGPIEYYDGNLFIRFSTDFGQKILYSLLHKFMNLFYNKGAFVIFGNVFSRADALEKIGGYDTSVVFYGDDTLLAKKLSAVGKILFKNDVVVRSSARRFNNIGTLNTTWKYAINYIWILVFNKPYHESAN